MKSLYIAKILQKNETALILTDGVRFGFLEKYGCLNSILKERRSELFEYAHKLPLENKFQPSTISPELIEDQPVWATGITYRWDEERLKNSDSNNPFFKLYNSERPMFFLKGNKNNHAHYNAKVGLRHDCDRSIPEAELVSVLNCFGEVIGFTIGNDQTALALEKENVMYQFQAKHFKFSHSILPMICLGSELPEIDVNLKVIRDEKVEINLNYSTKNFFKDLDQISKFLFNCNSHPHGIFLFLGFDGVFSDSFALKESDFIEIYSSYFPLKIKQTCIQV